MYRVDKVKFMCKTSRSMYNMDEGKQNMSKMVTNL